MLKWSANIVWKGMETLTCLAVFVNVVYAKDPTIEHQHVSLSRFHLH